MLMSDMDVTLYSLPNQYMGEVLFMKNVREMVDNLLCTGCSRCVLFCPHGFITMKTGDLGFPVPYIGQCKDCGACIRACPFSDLYDENENGTNNDGVS